MSEEIFYKKFFRWLSSKIHPHVRSAQGNDVMLERLMQMLENTEEVELSCDEVFDLLDQYAEMELSGEDAENLLPLVKNHLDKCKDCHEEYEALIRMLKASLLLNA